MHKQVIQIFILLVIFSTVRCNRSGEAYIPGENFSLECSMTDAILCISANENKNVYAGLQDDTSIHCRTVLDAMTPATFISSFDYTTVITAQFENNVLSAAFKDWVNELGMPQYSLPAKSMRICAFIDIDGNKTPDLGEPFLEQTVDFATPQLPFDNWTDY